MSKNCDSDSQNCTLKCCSQKGVCPSQTSGCYYYYFRPTVSSNLSIGAIVGIAFGVFLVVAVIIAFFLWRRRQQQRSMVQNQNNIGEETTNVTILNQKSGIQRNVPAQYNSNTHFQKVTLPFKPSNFTSNGNNNSKSGRSTIQEQRVAPLRFVSTIVPKKLSQSFNTQIQQPVVRRDMNLSF